MARALLAEIGHRLDPLAKRLGFARAPELRPGRYHHDWWYSREGSLFATELICFSLVSRPRRRLFIDLYGSPLSVQQLIEQGTEETLMGENLFNYQFHSGKKVEDILPIAIPVDEKTDLDELFNRAEAQLASVLADFWRELYDVTLQNEPEWLTRWGD